MKVGIMSMQRIINYGSFLQAYALKKTLESLGHEVEFVDYHAGEPIVQADHIIASQSSLTSKVINNLFSKEYRKRRKNEIRQNEAFREYYDLFNSDWLPLLGITEDKNYNPKLDLLVIGSDEVFNCTQPYQEVGFSPELFGANSNAKKIITYAASFGSTTLEKLKRYNKADEIASYLFKIDSISVRDNNSFEIIKELIGTSPVMNVDPVLIYDFNKEVPDVVDLDNYVIVYAYSGRITDKEAEAIQRFAHENGKKTLSIGVMQAFTDEYRCVDPFSMLAYFKNADYVVTDTFHGTVFSLKYQVPFATIIRDSNREKLTDLLEKFDLLNRAANIDDIELVLKIEMMPEEIKRKIKKYENEALVYLKDNN